MRGRTLRADKPRPAEGQGIASPFFAGKPVVSLAVKLRVDIPQLIALALVGELGITAPQVLAAIGLEAVNAHLLKQIGAFLQPPGACRRVGDIPQIPIAEPGRPDFVQAAVGFAHAKTPLLEIRAIGFVLGMPPLKGPEYRNLPQQDTDVLPVQIVNHPLRIGPFALSRESEVGAAQRAHEGAQGVKMRKESRPAPFSPVNPVTNFQLGLIALSAPNPVAAPLAHGRPPSP